jgi:hypothetical protein
MSFSTLILPVALALFLSAFIRQVGGFGHALIAMPLVTFVAGIRIATPLVALAGVVIGLAATLGSWRHIERSALRRLLAAALLGIPCGVLLFGWIPEEWVKRGLGCVLIGFSCYSLLMPPLPASRADWATWLFGFISGLLTGAYNTGGPPVVIYGTLRRWSPVSFRATLQPYFLVTSIFATAGHILAGLWTSEALWLFVCSLPALLFGLFLGERVTLSISKVLFNRIVYGLLIATGLLFFW